MQVSGGKNGAVGALRRQAGGTQTGKICMQTVRTATPLGSLTYITVVYPQNRAHKRKRPFTAAVIKCKDFTVKSGWIGEAAHSEQRWGAWPPGFKHQLCVAPGKSLSLCLLLSSSIK